MTSHDALACPCATALTQALATGKATTCQLCGATLQPQERPRTHERRLGDPVRDLELLARHLSTIVGRAAGVEPTVPSGTAKDGRADSVDESHRGLADAIRVMRRLASVDPRARLVLVYAYLVAGEEARARRGFNNRVGLVFATSAQRMSWLTQPEKAMGLGAATTFGTRLVEAATQAYAGIEQVDHTSDGRWIAGDIDRVTKMDAKAAEDVRVLVRVREQNRCKPPPGAPKNRKERREVERTNKSRA